MMTNRLDTGMSPCSPPIVSPAITRIIRKASFGLERKREDIRWIRQREEIARELYFELRAYVQDLLAEG
jgi:hypothetical protein